jgi:hypothetical protein
MVEGRRVWPNRKAAEMNPFPAVGFTNLKERTCMSTAIVDAKILLKTQAVQLQNASSSTVL